MKINTKESSTEGRILNAIGVCKNRLYKIVSINIPLSQQNELLTRLVESTDRLPTPDLKLKTIYGYPVKNGKVLSITIEI